MDINSLFIYLFFELNTRVSVVTITGLSQLL